MDHKSIVESAEIPVVPIVLAGMMGSGKSAIGRRLAKILNRDHADLDTVIEASEGMRVHTIFKRKGEDYFRQLEKRKLLEILQSKAPIVLSLGGGALQNENIANFIADNAILCFINPSMDTIVERVLRNKKRPLLLNERGEHKPEAEIRHILNELYYSRLSCYEKAHIHFHPVENKSIHQTACDLLTKITENVR
ncbi:MAG: shikimate kinase [Balneolales bacterium]|nr:shikimate kinase [Balneolales bacterium]